MSLNHLLLSELLRSLVSLWSDLCVKQDFLALRQSLPSNSSYFHRLCARPGFKPTACAFTFCMAEDPFSKNEFGLVFFVLFDGFHPSLWLPCPLQHVRELTPNGIALDHAIWEFHSLNKHFFPVEAYSACKLMKSQRIEAILEKIKKEEIPIHNLKDDISFQKQPWFDFEMKLFGLLPKGKLSFIRFEARDNFSSLPSFSSSESGSSPTLGLPYEVI